MFNIDYSEKGSIRKKLRSAIGFAPSYRNIAVTSNMECGSVFGEIILDQSKQCAKRNMLVDGI